MRTTLNIEDELLAKAAELTGIKEKTSLVRLGLEALIARESAKRLAALAGTEKKLEMIPRRSLEEVITWSWLTPRFGWPICGREPSDWKPCCMGAGWCAIPSSSANWLVVIFGTGLKLSLFCRGFPEQSGLSTKK